MFGLFDIDSSWYNKHNIFLRKSSLVCNYVIEMIDNDEMYSQLLKRLCRYLTTNPLAPKSKDLSGKIVYQKDLQDSLQEQSSEGTNIIIEDNNVDVDNISNQCLFNGSFNQEMKRMEQCYIFVHNYQNRVRTDEMGDIYIRIDIIIPDKYDTIYDANTQLKIKRGDAICILIDDMLNNQPIKDEKYKDLIGDTTFKFLDNGKERLTKTSDGIIYSLVYKVPVSASRVHNGII